MKRCEMIIVRTAGGLGNQLFMYAAARAASLRLGKELYVDQTTGFFHDSFHRYPALACVGILYRKATEKMKFQVPFGRFFRVLSFRTGRHWLHPSVRIITETGPDVPQPELFLYSPGGMYLMGSWQSECYFADHASVIREDFHFPLKSFSPETLQEAERIVREEERTVAVGIRRYQEVKNAEISCGSVLAGKEFYRAAMKKTAERVEDPHFFVFSQDQDWCRKNLPQEYRITYVQPGARPGSEAEDLWLQTLCRHHIFSYSSFYWWGTWLSEGNRRGGLVYVPFLKDFPLYFCRNWQQIMPEEIMTGS